MEKHAKSSEAVAGWCKRLQALGDTLAESCIVAAGIIGPVPADDEKHVESACTAECVDLWLVQAEKSAESLSQQIRKIGDKF